MPQSKFFLKALTFLIWMNIVLTTLNAQDNILPSQNNQDTTSSEKSTLAITHEDSYEPFQELEANIYPVPTDGFLTLELNHQAPDSEVHILITNMNGQMVYENTFQQVDRERFNLTYLNFGLYNMKIRNGKNIIQRLFLKTQ